MSGFGWGLFFGSTCTIALAAVVGAWAYQRFVLLERRARQAERLAEIGSLTGGLAHEIKNPLSTVQLNLQLLHEDLLPDNPAYSRIVSRLGTVQRETTRLRDILEDFLRYAGRLELDRKPTELNNLLEELVDFFVPQAQVHRVQLRLKKSPTPIAANIDPKLLKQAILNLMINAIQAMPEGGELILCVELRGREAYIEVTDTGTGIDPDILPKIFQAYYTTKRGGTGIGLAMTQRIVEEHGGKLHVDSEPTKGTRFSIFLPL